MNETDDISIFTLLLYVFKPTKITKFLMDHQ